MVRRSGLTGAQGDGSFVLGKSSGLQDAEHIGAILCVEDLWHDVFGFPVALGRVAVV